MWRVDLAGKLIWLANWSGWRIDLAGELVWLASWSGEYWRDCSNATALIALHDCSNATALIALHDCSNATALIALHDCNNATALIALHDYYRHKCRSSGQLCPYITEQLLYVCTLHSIVSCTTIVVVLRTLVICDPSAMNLFAFTSHRCCMCVAYSLHGFFIYCIYATMLGKKC